MHTAPTMKHERELAGQGFQLIAGVDEVGRGAWAGPIVACAVIMPFRPRLRGIRDSKLLSRPKRELLAGRIRSLAWSIGVGVVSHEEIDRSGINAANQRAMQHAIAQLRQVDFLLVDGRPCYSFDTQHTAIINGDALVYSIAAASIVAKVERDHIMREYHGQFPEYAFVMNKGYGTAGHQQALHTCGLSPIHRRSFQPMCDMLQ